jgi:E3 ubiquitin-protein ligase UBR3
VNWNFTQLRQSMVYFLSVQQAGKFKGNGAPWPPFRIPGPCHPAYEDPRKLLQSRVFHAMMFVVLYKAVHGQDVSEHVIALAIYLLEMAVESAEPFNQQSQVCFQSELSVYCVCIVM